jgi:hypothetical protein
MSNARRAGFTIGFVLGEATKWRASWFFVGLALGWGLKG